jgi:hypothetical protein
MVDEYGNDWCKFKSKHGEFENIFIDKYPQENGYVEYYMCDHDIYSECPHGSCILILKESFDSHLVNKNLPDHLYYYLSNGAVAPLEHCSIFGHNSNIKRAILGQESKVE